MTTETKVVDLFEYATRNRLRFASTHGELTVERLWEVPLRSADDFNLDAVAKAANAALQAVSKSFVDNDDVRTPARVRLEVTFAVVERVIQVKLAEEVAAKRRAEAKVEKEKIQKILAEKQEGRLSELPEKELQKRLHALSNEI